MIELRARFDELNNFHLAEDLKKAGAEVKVLGRTNCTISIEEDDVPKLEGILAREYSFVKILPLKPPRSGTFQSGTER